MFFKRKDNFPMEEKEEVLKGNQPVPQFRQQDELMPPKLPDMPKPMPSSFGDVKLPENQKPIAPNPITPKPIPQPIHEVHKPVVEKPHVFIKVEKYKDVMQKLSELANNIQSISNELDSLKAMESQENTKIDESEKTIGRINEIIKFLDETFKNAEM